MGLDVTATMYSVGVVLEWPPREQAVQVAFVGAKREEEKRVEPVATGQVEMFAT